jgi:hypothetical protein
MTDIPLDLTGATVGDAIVIASVSPPRLKIGPPTVQSITLDLAAGDTTADLPSVPANTSKLVVKAGTGGDVQQFKLRYVAATDIWEDEQPLTNTSQGDSWAMDMGGYAKAQLVNYNRIVDPVPYGVPFALLSGSHNLSASNFNTGTHTGVVTVDDTTDAGGHSSAFTDTSAGAYLRIRDNLISFTGRTSTTFTGCAVVQGSRGTIESDVYVSQGRDGGYGFNNIPIKYAAQMFAAGFRLQESYVALMNSSADGKRFSVGAYWLQYDPGDANIPYTVPMSGGMGVGNVITSQEAVIDIPPQVHGERSFYMSELVDVNENPVWKDWALATPTKKFLVPVIVGKHEAGAVQTGSVLDLKLVTRWVADGV